MRQTPSLLPAIIITVFIHLILSGCQPLPPPAEPPSLADVRSISVLPFESAAVGDRAVIGEEASVLESGARTMTALLADTLKDISRVRIISEDQAEGLTSGRVSDRIAIAREIGKQLGDDAVLIGSLYRYQQRQGRDYSVIAPASLDFDLKLVSAANGAILWSGRFNETQLSLFENILDFFTSSSRGFKWITVEELASEGIRKKLDDCPYIQRLKGN